MSLRNPRVGRLVAAALVVGLAARLAFALLYWQGKPLTHDEQEYLALALNLAAGRGYARELPGLPAGPTVEVFSRAPLYPYVLAAWFAATGHSTARLPPSVPASIQVLQALWSLLTIYLVSRLAARAAGPTAGVVAAWLAALYPPLVWNGAYALSESLYSPLVLGCAWIAGLILDRPDAHPDPADPRRAFLAGGLAGVAALARSAALVYVPLVAAWLVWRRRWRLAAGLVLGAMMIVGPWALRNTLVHGRLIVVAADGGITFWTGNHRWAIGEGDMAANPRIKADHAEFRGRLEHLSPEAREPYYYAAAFDYIRDHPGAWLALLMRKAVYTWVPFGPSYTLHSPRYFWASVLSYLPLLLLAAAGVPRLLRSPWRPRALGLLVASSVLVCLVFFPQERFRLPVIDPALCVAAAAWIAGRSARI
jgi:4-amino-4-deoxy-L-arabinose transferase-like glycosyltransferase